MLSRFSWWESKRKDKMKTEPIKSALRKARADYKKTRSGRLEGLLADQTYWQRRVTIASNKLARVRREIVELAINATNIADEREP
jgi:hypothetical protein